MKLVKLSHVVKLRTEKVNIESRDRGQAEDKPGFTLEESGKSLKKIKTKIFHQH